MSYIHSIFTQTPPHSADAEQIVNWAKAVYSSEQDFRKFKFLVAKSGIEKRYSLLPDFSDPAAAQLFKTDNGFTNPGTGVRMELYNRLANQLALKVSRLCLKNGSFSPGDITHLITVSCTGLQAPGMEIQLSHGLGLNADIDRSAVNFMGCYAAFHALKMGDRICRSEPHAKVLIVCAEACTLHFRQSGSTDDLLSAILFGDGAAALIMTPDRVNQIGIQWLAQRSSLIHAPEEMSWKINDHGFQMRLSQEVPRLIEENIGLAFTRLMQKSGVEKPDYYAIHPGGKNILKAFETAIGVDSRDLSHSYRVLKDYGNMSSPSVLFVIESVVEEFKAQNDKSEAIVFCAAFGPGLTVETALLKLEK